MGMLLKALCADIPGTEEYQLSDGHGAALSFMDRGTIVHRGMLSHLLKTAKRTISPFSSEKPLQG